MDVAFLAPLAALALIDATSFGTLLIPVWLLLTPGQLRPGRYLVFLATVATFYLAVGALVLLGGGALVDDVTELVDSRPASVVQLVVGAAMLVGSFFIGRTKTSGPGRFSRWRERAMGDRSQGGSARGLVGLALAATTVELATMLPYIGALGLLMTSGHALPTQLGVLAGYCLLMIVPALLLLVLRLVARRRVEPVLQRFSAWMERTSGETTAWIVGLVGFFLLRDAMSRLPDLADWLPFG